MPTTGRPRLHVQPVDDIAVVGFLDSRIVGEEDVQQVGEQLKRVADDDGYDKLVVDFKKVRFLSSALLGKLIPLHKALAARGGWLRLCGIDANLLEVFRVSHLDKLFAIYDDEVKALKA